MSDLTITPRCPRCHGTVTEYAWHPFGIHAPPAVRLECERCSWIQERGSLGAPRTA